MIIICRYLVSACLVGINCRFDGKSSLHPEIAALTSNHILIPVCPEQLGGLSTPRAPAEIIGGDGHRVLAGKAGVINNKKEDVTAFFIRGAEETLKLATLYRVKGAILKANSPSCGINQIYDGSFKGKVIAGCGVTVALLLDHGLKLIDELLPAPYWRQYLA